MIATQKSWERTGPLDGERGRRRHVCGVTETYAPEINGVALTLGHLVDGLRARGHVVSVVRPRQRLADSAVAPHDPPDAGARGSLALIRGPPFGLPAGRPAPRELVSHRPECLRGDRRPARLVGGTDRALLGIPVLAGSTRTSTLRATLPTRAGSSTDRPLSASLPQPYRRHSLVPTVELRDRLRSAGFRTSPSSPAWTPAVHPVAAGTPRCGSLGRVGSDLVALYVGRIAPEKNVELAVRAYHAMHGSPLGPPRGCGRLPLAPGLRAALPRCSLSGEMTGEALAEHYASPTSFCFPREETSGTVTLEAMASGLVVVAYDYAAARRTSSLGTRGPVPYRDADAFVEAAAALARSPERRLAMALASAGAVAHLHWDHVVARFETWLAGRGARRSDPEEERESS